MTAVIELKNVSKHYGPHRALDGVSLEVPAGVVFALLGENGAGKTTAIRLMQNFTKLVRYDGTVSVPVSEAPITG